MVTVSRVDVERIATAEPARGIGPSGAAKVLEFRRAAVALTASVPGTEHARLYGAQAATALVDLARAGEEDRLREILRPEPSGTEVIWTVACYQIGDLSPTALRDFPEAAAAVATLAQCPDPAHAAAELLASTASGVRWTAMVRTGDTVRFQLLSNDTGSDASSSRPGCLTDACEGWARLLTEWAQHPDAGLLPQLSQPTSAPALLETTADAVLSAGALGLGLGQILEAVRSLERRIDDRSDAAQVLGRMDALERRVSDLQLQLQLASVLAASSTGPTLPATVTAGSPGPSPLEAVAQPSQRSRPPAGLPPDLTGAMVLSMVAEWLAARYGSATPRRGRHVAPRPPTGVLLRTACSTAWRTACRVARDRSAYLAARAEPSAYDACSAR